MLSSVHHVSHDSISKEETKRNVAAPSQKADCNENKLHLCYHTECNTIT